MLNLSGFLSSSPDPCEGNPPQEMAFSRRSPVSPWATPLSGPLCFWSQTPAKTGVCEHFASNIKVARFGYIREMNRTTGNPNYYSCRNMKSKNTMTMMMMMLEGQSGQTLVSWTVCTSLFLLPAYIICCSGLQPAGNTHVNHREAGHM